MNNVVVTVLYLLRALHRRIIVYRIICVVGASTLARRDVVEFKTICFNLVYGCIAACLKTETSSRYTVSRISRRQRLSFST